MAELAHMAVVVGDENYRARLEAEARARVFNELYASEYVERLQRGETGAATAYLGGLRRGSGADPWQLLEAVARRVLTVREHGQDPGVAGPAQATASATVTEPREASNGTAG